MNDSEPQLPRELNDFQAALAGVMPNPDRLSAEQIWFRAGCDAERRRAAASAGRHPRWFRSPIASLAAGVRCSAGARQIWPISTTPCATSARIRLATPAGGAARPGKMA